LWHYLKITKNAGEKIILPFSTQQLEIKCRIGIGIEAQSFTVKGSFKAI